MFKNLINAFKTKEVRVKLLLTLLLLLIYRIGCFLPIPGLQASSLVDVTTNNSFLGLLNSISGGSLSNGAFLALGVSPYISSSIIIQLLSIAIPSWQRLSKEGEEGRKKMAKYTRICALILSIAQAVGIVIGFLVDLFINKNTNEEKKKIHEMCEHDHCDCEHHGVLLSSIKHTLTVSLFILAANVIIGLLIMFIGEDAISNVLLQKNILVYLLASLIGLIPNCAASVIITELYLGGFITIGVTMAGLLTGSGIGLLMLFKTNKNLKENMTILSIVYLSGVIIGLLVDLFI